MNALSKVRAMRRLGESYHVKVKVSDGWRNHSVARLHISVGQEYHEAEKFEATIAWARENFDQVIICVNDTLQRHNFIFQGMSSKDAHEVSKRAGEEWIERNTTPEMRTDTNLKIVRWDDWMRLDNYDETLKGVRQIIASNRSFGDAIESETLNFWERNKARRNLKTDRKKEDFLQHSRDYLIEECAVFSMMFDRSKAADVYPGSTLIPCQLFKIDKVAYRGFTRIEFKRAITPKQGVLSRDNCDTLEKSAPVARRA